MLTRLCGTSHLLKENVVKVVSPLAKLSGSAHDDCASREDFDQPIGQSDQSASLFI